MSVIQRPREGYACSIPRKVKVYDVEKKELIGTFETIASASKFCGIPPNRIYNYIKDKTRSHQNRLGKIICFR